MKPLISLFALLMFSLFWIACKKGEITQPNTNPPKLPKRNSFEMIPDSNVRWKVHCQGIMNYDPVWGYVFDSNFHLYTEVTGNGDKAIFQNVSYHVYHSVTHSTYGADPSIINTWTQVIYIREDTAAKKVYSLYNTVLLDYNVNVGDSLKVWPRWAFGTIQEGNLSIDSVTNICWNVHVKNHTYFLLGYGIGGQMGILTRNTTVCGNAGEVRSLDFIYNSDSLHFDFDVY